MEHKLIIVDLIFILIFDRLECPYAEIECTYHSIGCSIKVIAIIIIKLHALSLSYIFLTQSL